MATLLKVYAPAALDVTVANRRRAAGQCHRGGVPARSADRPGHREGLPLKLKAATVTLAPFTVTAWLVGVNVKPALVGVTV